MARQRIGKLRKRVTIQRRAKALDNSFGLSTNTWTDLRTIAAKVESLNGRELELARQRVPEASLIVTIRHVVGLTTSDRLKYGNRILEIGSVADPDETKRFLTLLCSETVTA